MSFWDIVNKMAQPEADGDCDDYDENDYADFYE